MTQTPPVQPNLPSPAAPNKAVNFLHDPALQLGLYGALTAADLHAAHQDRQHGGSGLMPLLAAGALTTMGAPYAIEAYQKHAPAIQKAFASAKNRLAPVFNRGLK